VVYRRTDRSIWIGKSIVLFIQLVDDPLKRVTSLPHHLPGIIGDVRSEAGVAEAIILAH
jgi:hypothetical protein